MLLTIAIPTYNPKTFIHDAIKSVLSGGFDFNTMEIFVLDNASESVDVQKICSEYPYVKYLRNEINIGMTENWNRCISIANGKFIHILHDDDQVCGNFYSTLAELLQEKDPEIILTGYSFLFNGKQEAAKLPWLGDSFLHSEKELLYQKQLIQPPSIILSKKIYIQFGTYINRFYPVQDWEAYCRFFSSSSKIYFTNKINVNYRIHDVNFSSSEFNKLKNNLRILFVNLKVSRYSHIENRFVTFLNASIHQKNWITAKYGSNLNPNLRVLFKFISLLVYFKMVFKK